MVKSWNPPNYTLAQWASNYRLFYNAIKSYATTTSAKDKKSWNVMKIFKVVYLVKNFLVYETRPNSIFKENTPSKIDQGPKIVYHKSSLIVAVVNKLIL